MTEKLFFVQLLFYIVKDLGIFIYVPLIILSNIEQAPWNKTLQYSTFI